MPAAAGRFNSFVSLATRLVTKNGRSVTLVSHSADPLSDPLQSHLPDDQSSSPQTSGLTGVFIDIMTANAMAADGGFAPLRMPVGKTATAVLIDAQSLNGTDVLQEDDILDGSTTWSIFQVEVIQPGQVPILYIIGAEK